MSTDYEFTEAENTIIGTTGQRATVWGIVSIVIGVVQLIMAGLAFAGSNALVGITQTLAAVVGVVVGAVFIGVGSSLKSVVTTEGNDVTLMMEALRKLTMAFTIQLVMVVVGFVVGCVAGGVLTSVHH